MTDGVIILGNGGGGTSMLRGLINAHPECDIAFEYGRTLHMSPDKELFNWREQAKKSSYIWGNKVPIEQFITRKWSNSDIINIIDYFKVIWLFRRFSKYLKPQIKEDHKKRTIYRENWKWGQELYWEMKERYPDKVIQVSFEDILLRPVIELRRICNFIEIVYNQDMLNGLMDTGYKKYNQRNFNLEKV